MTEAAASGPARGRIGGIALRGPMRLLTDEGLSRLATRGDERAFEEIYRRYHQQLYRFCLATVSNPQDAQEALQNAMVKVMRALPGEEREIKLKPWLYRIARNEAVETMRRRRDNVELGPDQIGAPWEIAEAVAARERLRDLFADLKELPDRQRSALVMRELGGLDFAEIGEAFGTTPAVARQTLYEARQSLRQMDEGREMSCETVRHAISDADGRVTRRRDIRAHLRGCASCRGFRSDIARRRQDFAAIAPLPLAVSLGLVQGLLAGQASGAAAVAGGASGGLAGTLGFGAGKVVATSAVVKSAATVAVVAAVGVGAADRSGVIDLPTPGGDGKGAKRDAVSPSSPRTGENAGSTTARQPETGAAARNQTGANPIEAGRGRDSAGSVQPSRRARRALRAQKGRPVHPGKSARPSRSKRPGGSPARGEAPAGRGGTTQGTPSNSTRGGQSAAGRKSPAASTPSPSRPGGKAAPTPPKAESAPPAPVTPEAAPTAPPAAANGGGATAEAVLPPTDAAEP